MYIKPMIVEERIIEKKLLFACYMSDEGCELEGGTLNTASEGL